MQQADLKQPASIRSQQTKVKWIIKINGTDQACIAFFDLLEYQDNYKWLEQIKMKITWV